MIEKLEAATVAEPKPVFALDLMKLSRILQLSDAETTNLLELCAHELIAQYSQRVVLAWFACHVGQLLRQAENQENARTAVELFEAQEAERLLAWYETAKLVAKQSTDRFAFAFELE